MRDLQKTLMALEDAMRSFRGMTYTLHMECNEWEKRCRQAEVRVKELEAVAAAAKEVCQEQHIDGCGVPSRMCVPARQFEQLKKALAELEANNNGL